MDGYHNVPKDFKQLISVFGYSESNNGAFAIFHCLLNFKTEDQYKFMFEEFKTILKAYHPNFIFDPEICMTSCEKGLIAALKYSFPNARNSGCFFIFYSARYAISKLLSFLKKKLRIKLSNS